MLQIQFEEGFSLSYRKGLFFRQAQASSLWFVTVSLQSWQVECYTLWVSCRQSKPQKHSSQGIAGDKKLAHVTHICTESRGTHSLLAFTSMVESLPFHQKHRNFLFDSHAHVAVESYNVAVERLAVLGGHHCGLQAFWTHSPTIWQALVSLIYWLHIWHHINSHGRDNLNSNSGKFTVKDKYK